MKHEKESLDMYEIDFMPKEMKAYLRNYGFSFSKKACEYAISLMRKENPATKKEEKIEPWSKEQVEEMLKKYNVTLENNVGAINRTRSLRRRRCASLRNRRLLRCLSGPCCYLLQLSPFVFCNHIP